MQATPRSAHQTSTPLTTHAFPRHAERDVRLTVSPEVAFADLDDFRKLSAHMEKSSAAMMGSKMEIATDALDGRAIGSRIRMTGRVLGMALSLEEVVTERRPPQRKAWQTVDADLLVIGQYQLGFTLSPTAEGSLLRVFIDYDVPRHGLGRWLGKMFGGLYARWCVEKMAADAAARLNGRPVSPEGG